MILARTYEAAADMNDDNNEVYNDKETYIYLMFLFPFFFVLASKFLHNFLFVLSLLYKYVRVNLPCFKMKSDRKVHK